MATAAALQAKLADLNHAINQERQGFNQLDSDLQEASLRQDMRRQVEAAEEELERLQYISSRKRERRYLMDKDVVGNVADRDSQHSDKLPSELRIPAKDARTSTDIDSVVECGELTWEIKGFSWLNDALKQERENVSHSSCITVAGNYFSLVYHPRKGNVDDRNQRASLAIYHYEPHESSSLACRYKIFIKSSKRGFVQWGLDGHVCLLDCTDDMAIGPDVCSEREVPAGVFNMNHEELLLSEWVSNDTLIAKVEVAVRPESSSVLDISKRESEVRVLPPTMIADILSLLDDGSSGDVSFNVQDEVIKSHSSILCARSDVFRRMLNCGMRESSSKEIVIEDCGPKLFKAMLRFLYSDSFDHLNKAIEDDRASESSERPADDKAEEESTRSQALLKLLALSHKYQLARLQSWCEHELCGCISIEDACYVLCRAHLYEARQLEQVCLKFVKANMAQISKTTSFGVASRDWPEVMMKISICFAGLSEDLMLAAIAAQQASRKRKREE